MANFDINEHIIAREKLFHPCKIGRARCPADLLQRRPGTTQKNNLTNRPVPGRFSNSPVMCKSLKSYDVSFCNYSITCFDKCNAILENRKDHLMKVFIFRNITRSRELTFDNQQIFKQIWSVHMAGTRGGILYRTWSSCLRWQVK